MSTISADLAQFACLLEESQVPPEVLYKAKQLVLDTVGICLSSSRLPFGRDALALASKWEMASGVSLFGSQTRVAPHHAAFVNGILGHGQDYDDTHTESVVHPSGALVPVMLACAERDGTSGARALLALVAATETSIRLALPALNAFHLRGFHTTSVACTFGAALLSSLTRGASLETSVQALGICGSFASGLLECVPAASSAKRLHAGWAGLCGIMAGDLARVNFTGPARIVEGKLGLYNSMLRGEQFDLQRIFADIGERWEILDVRPKLYPCCHYLQSFLECAAVLRDTEPFTPDDVVSIDCRVAAGSVNMICDPWPVKIAPATGYEARFSLPYAVCVMLEKGRTGVAEFDESQLQDPRVLHLMGKVSYEVDPAYSVKDMPGSVAITMLDGRVLSHEVPVVRGDGAHPFSEDEILRKFHACASHLPRGEADRIAEAVLTMETLADLSPLIGSGIGGSY